MELTEEMLKELQQGLKNARSVEDLLGKDGAIKKLLKSSIEQMLESEMDEHLGYQKHSKTADSTDNSRNGYSKKKLKSSQGEIEITIPRDRQSEFEPVVVPKHKRNLKEIEDKVISMYAKGMTTRDIEAHIEEIYGVSLTSASISNITDSVLSMVEQWQNRALEELYPIIFLDAVHFKCKQDGHIVTKAAYTCLAIDKYGYKDMLGIWIGESESSKFWMNVLSELKQRGVKDILIACIDGLTGFTEAIEAIFPECVIQKCIIHQIRNTLRYIAHKDKKEFMDKLKEVYTAINEQTALKNLDQLEDQWSKKYPAAIKSWRNNWPYLSTFFDFPAELRKMIYTTNTIESLHRQFRKVTKTRTLFPNDQALSKILFLAYRDISKKWSQSVNNWPMDFSQLSIIFAQRIEKYL